MRWYRTLTRGQRWILLSLASALVLVIALFAWTIWSTHQAEAQQSDPSDAGVPTPTATVTRTATPTRQPSPTSTPPPVTEAAAAFDVFRAGVIAQRVADARESRTRWGTPLTVVDQTGMARVLYTHFEESPPLAMRLQPILQALNLGYDDTLRLDVVSQAEETAAFYVPELEELYLRRDWDGSIDTLELQLAYGYARALPDQFGDLSTLLDEATSLDLQIALAAVAEGEAMVSVWLLKDVVPSDPSAVSADAESLRALVAPVVCPRWQEPAPWLDALSCLAFDVGVPFVTAQYQAGGVEAMDEIVLRPPRSTEQLLYPERYAASDEPRVIAPLEPGLGSDWRLLASETLGEALMSRVLAAWGRVEDSETRPLEWGGDLLQVWTTQEDDPSARDKVAVWQIDLDDVRAALRFASELQELLPRALFDGRVMRTDVPESLVGGHWWAGRAGAVTLQRRANQVRLVWGSDPDVVEYVGVAAVP